MTIRFKVPLYFGGKFYEKFNEVKIAENGKERIVKPGMEYNLDEAALKGLDPNDYDVIDEDGDVVPPAPKKKTKGAPKDAENK